MATATSAHLGYIGRTLDGDDWMNTRLSRIGGRPVWSEQPSASAMVNRPEYLSCGVCGKSMALLGQFSCGYGAVPRRLLHIFSCPEDACGADTRAWKALRTTGPPGVVDDVMLNVAVGTKSTPVKATDDWGACGGGDWGTSGDDWGVGGDDWGSASASAGQGLDAEINALLEARTTAVAQPAKMPVASDDKDDVVMIEPWHGSTEPSVPERWPCVSLEIYAEPAAPANEGCGEHERELYERYLRNEKEDGEADAPLTAQQAEALRKEEEGLCAEGDQDGSDFDIENDLNDDEDDATGNVEWILRCQRRLERSPEQVVRYSWGGEALWLAAPAKEIRDKIWPPCCGVCGAKRIFELQILPTLVSRAFSAAGHGMAGSNVEWGTLVIYTCSGDCIAGDPVEEFVIVQSAE